MLLLNKSFFAGAILLSATTPVSAINIVFDYTYDTNSFFSNTTAKTALEAAGSYFSNLITDDLTAITPGGSNIFNATFSNPGTGLNETIAGYNVAADEVVVFAGGRSLTGSVLGRGGPGGYSAGGSSSFVENVRQRGEVGLTNGASPTEFAPWGGSITFDSDGTSVWHYDHTTPVAGGTSDFYSVALHELGHLLGIGTADSWDYFGSGGIFTGAESVALFGGPITLQPGLGHWENGTSSFVNGVAQEAAMDPSITIGTRKLFTALDVAGLDDLGWDIAVTAVPLPPAVLLFGSSLLGLLGFSKKKKKHA